MKTKNEIKFKGKTYPVWYRHERDYARCHPQNGNLIIEGRTTAYIELEKEVLEAFAECSVLDYYNRALGRTIAVGRLQKALEDKEYRATQQVRDPPKVVLSFKAQE